MNKSELPSDPSKTKKRPIFDESQLVVAARDYIVRRDLFCYDDTMLFELLQHNPAIEALMQVAPALKQALGALDLDSVDLALIDKHAQQIMDDPRNKKKSQGDNREEWFRIYCQHDKALAMRSDWALNFIKTIQGAIPKLLESLGFEDVRVMFSDLVKWEPEKTLYDKSDAGSGTLSVPEFGLSIKLNTNSLPKGNLAERKLTIVVGTNKLEYVFYQVIESQPVEETSAQPG